MNCLFNYSKFDLLKEECQECSSGEECRDEKNLPSPVTVTDLSYPWYQNLVRDLQDITNNYRDSLKQYKFLIEEELKEYYYTLGTRILSEMHQFNKVKIKETAAYHMIQEALCFKGERTVQRIVQFVKKYPNKEDIPPVAWHVICNELLPSPKCTHPSFEERNEIVRICKICGKKL